MGARDAIARAIAKGIKAFHSSPHDFDKFNASKIGTGEGAQVYGHGLYFAENPKVSGQGGEYWQQFLNRFNGDELAAAYALKQSKFDRDAAIAAARSDYDFMWNRYKALPPGIRDNPKAKGLPTMEALAGRQRELNLLESGKPVGPRTYEVNINADPAKFLDWDKSLAEQSPEVADALSRMGYFGEGRRASEGYHKYAQDYGGADAAADALLDRGIPGIRYLDQGSRAASVDIPALQMDLRNTVGLIGQLTEPANIAKHQARAAQIRGLIERAEAAKANPTSNYVMFPGTEHLIDITKKYAVPGAIGTGAMGATFDPSTYTAEEVQR